MTSAQASMQVTVKNSQKIHSVPQKARISLTPVTLLDLTNSQQCRSLSISMQHFQVVLFFEAGKVRTGKKTRKVQSFLGRGMLSELHGIRPLELALEKFAQLIQ